MSLTETATGRADIAAIYDAHFELLVGTAIRRFHIAKDEAETLAHDVFLSYMLKADEVRDIRAWLVGAICNASKYFLRVRSRTEPLAPNGDVPDASVDAAIPQLVARDCLQCLSARCQLALRLRYIEGYTVPEIARELGTSAKYAQKVVSKCLQQAQERFGGER